MKLIFLGNCAVYARQGDCGVLIDAPNGLHTTFDGMSESLFAQIAASEPPYDVLSAACFTHKTYPYCLRYSPGVIPSVSVKFLVK